MKTNKLCKLFPALVAVVILCAFAFTAFAETGVKGMENKTGDAVPLPESASVKEKKQQRSDRPVKHNSDWLEDWFEDRIEARSRYADFSELPEDPTDEEILEFFKKYFLGEGTATGKNLSGERSGDKGKQPVKHSEDPVIPELPEAEGEPAVSEPAPETIEEQPAEETSGNAA